ncbi:LysR family transcriptional regulator [Loktanella sp. DJP18]|uniref:LysR family transcriptional regulator n=1 Tax=Loktanella sp. DJP18 TaxID=3409788 RepID=UPI003BB542C2
MPAHMPRDGSAAALIQRGLRLPQLRLLIAVADLGQISGAASLVGMTQPAASRMLTDLERTVGTQLYQRHPRGVALTAAGALLAKRARLALQHLEVAFDEMDDIANGSGGLVRIGTVTGPGVALILPLIRDLRVTYPEIAFDVLVDTSDVLADALLAHRVDFYLGRMLANVSAQDVTAITVGAEPIALIVRKDHPLMTRPAPTLSDTLAYDWVMQASAGLMRQAVEAYLLQCGLAPPQRILTTSSLVLTLGIVSDTNVVAPVARSVAEVLVAPTRMNSDMRILDLAPDMAVSPYALVCRRDAEPNAAVARVLTLLRDRIAARAAGSG